MTEDVRACVDVDALHGSADDRLDSPVGQRIMSPLCELPKMGLASRKPDVCAVAQADEELPHRLRDWHISDAGFSPDGEEVGAHVCPSEFVEFIDTDTGVDEQGEHGEVAPG